jgi:hypothetical protein
MDSDATKLFEHLQLIVTMILTLAVGRILNGFARILAHPGKVKLFLPHLLWGFSMLLFLMNFWWWEFKLSAVKSWTFESCFLVLVSAIVHFLLCALLFPDQMEEYKGFDDYFISRRKWFFGILASCFLLDAADTSLRGMDYINSLGIEYPIYILAYVGLCVASIFIKNYKFHLSFVVVSLLYNISYFIRLYLGKG